MLCPCAGCARELWDRGSAVVCQAWCQLPGLWGLTWNGGGWPTIMNTSITYVEVQLMEIHGQKELGQCVLCQGCSLTQPQERLPSKQRVVSLPCLPVLVNWPSRAAGCGGMLSNCHVLTVREQMLWMLLDKVHWYPSASSKQKGWSLCLWIYSVTSLEIKSLLVPALHPTWLFTFQLSYYSYFHTARKKWQVKNEIVCGFTH